MRAPWWERVMDWFLWRELERDPFFGRGYARRAGRREERGTG